MNQFRKLTPEEVLFIFKEEHRLCSPLDLEADPDFELLPTSTVGEWRDAGNKLPWMDLRKVYNEMFSIQIDIESWRSAAGFSDEKPMQNVFDLIAAHAQIDILKPVKSLGKLCLSAAVFNSIRNNLALQGIDVSDLSPSTKIEPVLKKNFSLLFGYLNKNFTGAIPEFKAKETGYSYLMGLTGLLSIILLITGLHWFVLIVPAIACIVITIILGILDRRAFLQKEGMMVMSGIVTFRDLVNRIIEVQERRISPPTSGN